MCVNTRNQVVFVGSLPGVSIIWVKIVWKLCLSAPSAAVNTQAWSFWAQQHKLSLGSVLALSPIRGNLCNIMQIAFRRARQAHTHRYTYSYCANSSLIRDNHVQIEIFKLLERNKRINTETSGMFYFSYILYTQQNNSTCYAALRSSLNTMLCASVLITFWHLSAFIQYSFWNMTDFYEFRRLDCRVSVECPCRRHFIILCLNFMRR